MGHPLSLDRLHKNNLSKKNNTIFFGLQLIFVFVYLVIYQKRFIHFYHFWSCRSKVLHGDLQQKMEKQKMPKKREKVNKDSTE